jgi:hypothetical protein
MVIDFSEIALIDSAKLDPLGQGGSLQGSAERWRLRLQPVFQAVCRLASVIGLTHANQRE